MSHANRGKVWEQYLDTLHYRYTVDPLTPVAIERNHPEFKLIFNSSTGKKEWQPTGVGRPDYSGGILGFSVVTEAKEISTARFDYANIHAHQALSMERADRAGGWSFVLLSAPDAKAVRLGLAVEWQVLSAGWFSARRVWDRGEHAVNGTASVAVSALMERAFHVDRMNAFDWWEPALELMQSTDADARRTRLNAVPIPQVSLVRRDKKTSRRRRGKGVNVYTSGGRR